MTIETPQQLEQFKIGAFDDQYETIEVKASAHENIFSQLPYFPVKQHARVTDEHNNVIELDPKDRQVIATLRRGHTPLRYIPNDYAFYLIFYREEATVIANDVDEMAEWKHANIISLLLTHTWDPSAEFTQRIEYLQSQDHPVIKKVSIIKPNPQPPQLARMNN